ncbi:hypothetical protein DL768_007762 [Monosporascus sp. mg162]|nr:hypothetical protein DL768_007762 [Monosporascus sp. mg162]
MAVPFGFSVGDFLAVGKLIRQVAVELRENDEVAPEYQSLLIELEALDRALRKLQTLRPGKHELFQLTSIRATALACQRPLQDFLAKISKFESRLGTFNTANNRWKGLPRKMQFRIMFKEDVIQLRSALASYVATINLLLMTGQEASIQEIQAISNYTQDQTKSILATVTEVLALITSGLMHLRQITKQLHKMIRICTTFTAEMRTAMSKLMELFFSLQTVLQRIDRNLPTRLYLPTVQLTTALGETMALPYQLCQQWTTFTELLRVIFLDKPGKSRVDRGKYLIMNARGGRLLVEDSWQHAVKQDDHLSMSIVLDELAARPGSCPFPTCRASTEGVEIENGGRTCGRCGRWSLLTPPKQLLHNDALNYLDEVKAQFTDSPGIYDEFLNIMKDFKDSTIDTPGVMQRVFLLFTRNANLIQGFNNFLPPGYRIECGTKGDPIAISSSDSSNGQLVENKEDIELYRQIHVQYLTEETPQLVMRQAQWPVLDDALHYVNQVKTQFTDYPDAYHKFPDPAKLYRFSNFLPPGYKIECSTNGDPNEISVTTPMGTMVSPTQPPQSYVPRSVPEPVSRSNHVQEESDFAYDAYLVDSVPHECGRRQIADPVGTDSQAYMAGYLLECILDEGLAQVRASMPSVAGMAFGPLVLQDVMFKNMDLSMLKMVLAPRVTGARLLNECLSDPANPFDFFVIFSSFVMVSGNPGLAAYSAANAYTHALAQQRRARDMAESTIDIGAVFGIGFIARAGREHEYDVVKFIFDEVSEWEFHALFAEAVVAGRNREIEDVEVIFGMPYMDPANHDRIPYFDAPRFAYFKLSDRRVKSEDAAGPTRSVKDQLLRAETMDQVRATIVDSLSGRIRGALQLTPADELNLTTPLIDQGILGGASVTDLVNEAVSCLALEAIPLAHSGSSEEAAQPAAEAQLTAPSSTIGASDESTSSVDYDSIPTPPSRYSHDEEGSEREAPLSLTREYSWKQQLPLDPKTFNGTIGMYMQGPLNLNRLAWAFNQALQRNDAFRTCFIPDPDGSAQPIQAVMKSPRAYFEAVKVADKAAADQGFKDLEGYNQLYSGVQLELAAGYGDFVIPRLPALDLLEAKANAISPAWTEHELSACLNRMVAVRIKDRSRKHGLTPMHYYLPSFHVLLARLTSSPDVVIGIADTNRPTLTGQATMGYFANLPPVRLDYASDKIFNEALMAVKEQMRTALLHSAVPYGAILERLGLPAPSAEDPHSHAPLFQAVFDYKQGQAESANIGEAKSVDSRTPHAGSPYDITLEISDDPSKNPLITVKLQKGRYGPKDAEMVMEAYLSIPSFFSRNPALRVEDGRLEQGAEAKA